MSKIEDRIRAAMAGRTTVKYYELLDLVFPETKYPSSRRYSQNGGPPGCAMVLGAAIRRMGGRSHGQGASRTVYIPDKEDGAS